MNSQLPIGLNLEIDDELCNAFLQYHLPHFLFEQPMASVQVEQSCDTIPPTTHVTQAIISQDTLLPNFTLTPANTISTSVNVNTQIASTAMNFVNYTNENLKKPPASTQQKVLVPRAKECTKPTRMRHAQQSRFMQAFILK